MLNSIVKERSARRLTSGPHAGGNLERGVDNHLHRLSVLAPGLWKADCPTVQLINLGYPPTACQGEKLPRVRDVEVEIGKVFLWY